MKRSLSSLLTIFSISLPSLAQTDGLYIPSGNYDLYRDLDLSSKSPLANLGIKPYSCEKAVVISDRQVDYCKDSSLLKRVVVDFFYNSQKYTFSFLPEKEGIKLEEGINSIIRVSGDKVFNENLNFQYELRGQSNQESSSISVHRLSFTLNTDRWSVIAGKENLKVGPSRYGTLFSSTNPPFYQFRVQTRKPFEFYGLLDLTFMYGKLLEDRKDHSDPNLVFGRVDYKPNRYLEIGINRAVLFGGEGRPSYRFYEYPKVFIGREETLGGRFDNDSYFGYDIRLNLFFNSFDIFQVYYEANATDIESPLKKGDPKKLHFPLIVIDLHDTGKTHGIKIKKDRYLFNWELTDTGKSMYINHNYPVEGFSYKGFVLGYPYGRSVYHTFILFGILDTDREKFVEIGYIKQPWKMGSSEKFEDIYTSFSMNLKIGKITLQPYLKLDLVKNLNISENPAQINIVKNDEKYIFTGGFSVGYRF